MANVVGDADEAVSGIEDGSTVLIGGFGTAGQPVELIDALIRSGLKDLTVVNNNAGNGRVGLASLLGKRSGPQDHLLVPPAGRLLRLRRAISSGHGGA
jgi:acyl CoA:acetate/3-ketoacid CoA transferase alpha subunit